MFMIRSLCGVISTQCSFHRLHMIVIDMLPSAAHIYVHWTFVGHYTWMFVNACNLLNIPWYKLTIRPQCRENTLLIRYVQIHHVMNML